MRVHTTQANPHFIVYWLQSKEVRRYITDKATGASSTMKKITQGDVCSLPFPKIGLKQQREIASYLNTIKDKLNVIRHLQDQDEELIYQLEQSILERAFRGEL
jgi:type I restriction enzyme S subunit